MTPYGSFQKNELFKTFEKYEAEKAELLNNPLDPECTAYYGVDYIATYFVEELEFV